MKYGFIGGGKISEAIISGMVKSNVTKPEFIFVYDIDEAKMKRLREKYKVSLLSAAVEAAVTCKTVFLTVKPNVLGGVLTEIKVGVNVNKPFIISIAAGVTIKQIEEQLDYNGPVARVMPNYNALVCQSMSLVCKNHMVSDDNMYTLNECTNGIGKSFLTTEDKMPILTALCGCSPAFVYLFVDSLAKAAQKHGIDKKTALSLATQAVLGSTKLMEETAGQSHPWELIDAVCSPGGMTIEGICSLEKNSFQATITEAVEAAMRKDSILG